MNEIYLIISIMVISLIVYFGAWYWYDRFMELLKRIIIISIMVISGLTFICTVIYAIAREWASELINQFLSI